MEQSTDITTTTTVLSNGDIHNNDKINLLSEYEIRRAKNIEKNNARLVELGLLSVYEAKVSNASAWKKEKKKRSKIVSTESASSPSSSSSYSDDDGIKVSVSLKKKKKRVLQETITNSDNETTSHLVGTRKSLRLQGIAVPSSTESDIDINTIDIQLHREQRRRECQEVRQRIALEYATNTTTGTKKNTNPTATYEHCLYRIRTMSQKALENRIHIIERAAGKHSIIKMAITASCLQDAEMWDLATIATGALERLKALVPPPEVPTSSTVSKST